MITRAKISAERAKYFVVYGVFPGYSWAALIIPFLSQMRLLFDGGAYSSKYGKLPNSRSHTRLFLSGQHSLQRFPSKITCVRLTCGRSVQSEKKMFLWRQTIFLANILYIVRSMLLPLMRYGCATPTGARSATTCREGNGCCSEKSTRLKGVGGFRVA